MEENFVIILDIITNPIYFIGVLVTFILSIIYVIIYSVRKDYFNLFLTNYGNYWFRTIILIIVFSLLSFFGAFLLLLFFVINFAKS